ncbi:DNA-directed RNA polymerase subunit omega [Aquibacillus sp. 3ASR75-11]|uniref:DNA-directed RNA polymerase subunit omega n=1 Tax=Terrihalobacillus insolitus TaxID=2950438 RepID=A0A9X3WUI0_9BACI|nr:DNA-directed RNA polymerase subunit omega [Terrihalobacillus insolitus]MDC3412892.1 DNA-directed RNA polymerase subunit omega [Terrihalobacillus insolitus]MDC3423629.1 DNA-directed RNA polymerase subunit omega [Terrihalobacillus insolitus]
MMLEPSIDSLQTKINSKYTLVTLSAKRARQMQDEKSMLIEKPKSFKYVGIALEEILADKLTYTVDEEHLEFE